VVKKVRVVSMLARVERKANSKLVARMSPERKPVREEKRLLPRRKVIRTVNIPKKAEGNRTDKEVNPCQREDEKATNQKKRGGLSL
jgi:hypothetical protein